MLPANLVAFFLDNISEEKEIDLKYRQVKLKEIQDCIPTDRKLVYMYYTSVSQGVGFIDFIDEIGAYRMVSKEIKEANLKKQFDRFKKEFKNRSIRRIEITPDSTDIYFYGG